ncbi:MAG TPA: HAD family phosphatase [Myxococcales bacterium]|nr:HAD family phosphatase [Myxococcales bacterium]HIL02415.1 HAD family phosphatase [Myxococcales bacterium]
MTIRAIIFDLGGVVLGSPLHAIAAYERELGIPANFVNRVVADTSPDGAWSRLERGEISMETFYTDFESDCQAAGQTLSARTMFEHMAAAALPRPSMLEAIRRIRAEGFLTAALTNNWANEAADNDDSNDAQSRNENPEAQANAGPTGANDGTRVLSDRFDVFVESSVEGLRKPDPRIYILTCERLGVTPSEAVFLDDIGSNLKAARALGMTTIKVDAPEQALEELAGVIGLKLVD